MKLRSYTPQEEKNILKLSKYSGKEKEKYLENLATAQSRKVSAIRQKYNILVKKKKNNKKNKSKATPERVATHAFLRSKDEVMVTLPYQRIEIDTQSKTLCIYL